jgi:hypothetical protein
MLYFPIILTVGLLLCLYPLLVLTFVHLAIVDLSDHLFILISDAVSGIPNFATQKKYAELIS